MSLLPHHAAELIEDSGIDPAVIAARGCFSADADQVRALGFAEWQCRPGLVFPQWTLAGAQVNHLLKPDEPRTDEHGKRLKYEAPFGSVPHFDVHPEARHLLQDVSVPLYFTEGNKKSDAAWSRGLLCISLQGVWAFLRDRLITPELDEIPLNGRIVRLAFDSDVTRKESVAEAFLRFAAALSRRGAKVEIVRFPDPAQGGGKTGFDDYFVAGGTVDGLEQLTRPWDGKGPGIWLRETEDSDVATLRRENADLRASWSLVIQAILNPHNTRNELTVMAALAGPVLFKGAQGQVGPDGRIRLSSAEIGNDWRQAPPPGERVAPVNPKDGSRPRIARDKVTPLMKSVTASGRVLAFPEQVPKERKDGSTFRVYEWLIDPVGSLAAFLNPWATYEPDAPKQRKPRTLSRPCPSCGEVHAIYQIDVCSGCGTQIADRLIDPVTAENLSDNLSDREPPSPSPSHTLYVPENIGQVAAAPDDDDPFLDPDPTADLSDKTSDTPTSSVSPDLTPVQDRLAVASRGSAVDAKQALTDAGDALAALARARGREPVPKPTPRPRDSWEDPGQAAFFATSDPPRRSAHFDVGD